MPYINCYVALIIMRKFKLTWERSQNGKIFTDWTKETIVETYREPKIGEGRSLLVDPPIHEYIVKVELVAE